MLSIASHPHGTPVRVGVYGASGTSGTELVALLDRHPWAQLVFATSRTYAGQTLRDVDPAAVPIRLVDPSDAEPADVHLVFSCLPHGDSAPVVERALRAGARVVDLSGDFRLREPALHARVYGSERSAEVATQAVYGLTELRRDRLAGAALVANPGCYPTCAALGLAPLVARGWVQGPIIIDAKSGVSGAGRGATPSTHFIAVADDVRPYKLGRQHRHTAEIEQTLADVSPAGVAAPSVIFNPHVVPIERGMLATMVVHVPDCESAAVLDALVQAYADEPMIEVTGDRPARIRAVRGTNRAQIGVTGVPGTDRVVVTSAIDNLGKGAAGQALQNANRMLGLPETLGVLPATGTLETWSAA